MPQPAQLTKAELREIQWDQEQQASETGKKVPIQFNPQSLKVTFSNQLSGGDQSGGAGKQYVGKGATKLAMELWFDVTAPQSDGNSDTSSEDDVRQITKDVVYFITPKQEGDKYIPPGVRFIWGTFLFDGIVESMDETLEFFSEDGKPLRSRISLNISQQEIQFRFNEGASAAAGTPPGGTGSSGAAGASGGGGGSTAQPGTEPLEQTQAGDTVQDVAGRTGQAQDWQNIALANNIENPRRLEPGTLLNVNISADIEIE